MGSGAGVCALLPTSCWPAYSATRAAACRVRNTKNVFQLTGGRSVRIWSALIASTRGASFALATIVGWHLLRPAATNGCGCLNEAILLPDSSLFCEASMAVGVLLLLPSACYTDATSSGYKTNRFANG